MSAVERFYIRIDNLAHAEGEDSELAFTGTTADAFAEEFQRGLREPGLFKRWKQKQEDPEAVSQSLAPVDANAIVKAEGHDLHTDVQVVTDLPHAVVKHRLTLLIGHHWTLRDVRAA